MSPAVLLHVSLFCSQSAEGPDVQPQERMTSAGACCPAGACSPALLEQAAAKHLTHAPGSLNIRLGAS